MPYKVPSDEEVLRSIRNVMNSYGIVNSQTKLKTLVERDLKETDENYRVSQRRMRILALSSDKIKVEIHCRETDKKKGISKCPVCGHNLRIIKNKTVFDGVVNIGHECRHCSYWTGLRRRVPIRYIFSSK